MRVMGLRESVYWLSWYASFLVFLFLAALSFSLAGKLFTNIAFFENTAVFVIVFYAFSYLACASTVSLLFCSFLTKPRSILAAQILLIAAPVIFLDRLRAHGHSLNVVPETPFQRLYHPDNSLFLQFLLQLLPCWHLAKMTADIYAVTGKGGNNRSSLQQHERFWQQPNNSTNVYDGGLFFERIGYNGWLGFPKNAGSTSLFFGPEERPLDWTITTENDIVTQIYDNQWWSYDSKMQLWVSKGEQWFLPSTAWSCMWSG